MAADDRQENAESEKSQGGRLNLPRRLGRTCDICYIFLWRPKGQSRVPRRGEAAFTPGK